MLYRFYIRLTIIATRIAERAYRQAQRRGDWVEDGRLSGADWATLFSRLPATDTVGPRPLIWTETPPVFTATGGVTIHSVTYNGEPLS